MSANVLVLEDDQGIANLIERALTRAGYIPQVYFDDKAALARVKESPEIEVAVLDYRFSPKVTGIDFFKSATEQGWKGSAILITGFLEERIILESLRAGLNDVFPKTPDFIEHLVTSVRHLVTFQRHEKELHTLRQEQELIRRMSASYVAAGVVAWCWTSGTKVIETAGMNLFSSVKSPKLEFVKIETLLDILKINTQRKLFGALSKARRNGVPFEVEVEVETTRGDQQLAFFIRGEWRSKTIVSGVAVDVTDRVKMERERRLALEDLQELNKRLQFSISETHHRVKNSLQMVSSLLTLEFRKTHSGNILSSRRILSQIRALALLHDLLTDVSKDGRDMSAIKLQNFFSELALLISRARALGKFSTENVEIVLSPRQGSSLAIVLTEILFAVPERATAEIRVLNVNSNADVQIEIYSANTTESKEEAENFIERISENQLIKMLLKTDFDTNLSFKQKNDGVVLVKFMIENKMPQEKILGAYQ